MSSLTFRSPQTVRWPSSPPPPLIWCCLIPFAGASAVNFSPVPSGSRGRSWTPSHLARLSTLPRRGSFPRKAEHLTCCHSSWLPSSHLPVLLPGILNRCSPESSQRWLHPSRRWQWTVTTVFGFSLAKLVSFSNPSLSRSQLPPQTLGISPSILFSLGTNFHEGWFLNLFSFNTLLTFFSSMESLLVHRENSSY